MKHIVALSFALGLFLFTSAAEAQGLRPTVIGAPSGGQAALAADLEKIQGTWEYVFKDARGLPALIKVKNIRGTSESVSWFLPNGSLVAVNRAEFALEIRNGQPWFVWYNGWWVLGQQRGKPFHPGEVRYKLDNDVWSVQDDYGRTNAWRKVASTSAWARQAELSWRHELARTNSLGRTEAYRGTAPRYNYNNR